MPVDMGNHRVDGPVAQIPDVLEDPAYGVRDVARTATYRSIVSVPMLRDGAIKGVNLADSARNLKSALGGATLPQRDRHAEPGGIGALDGAGQHDEDHCDHQGGGEAEGEVAAGRGDAECLEHGQAPLIAVRSRENRSPTARSRCSGLAP